MPNPPIAFFAYNRPEHTKQALESLSQCEGAAKSELFIYSDGSKQSEDVSAVQEVRTLIKNRKWCGIVHIIEQNQNLGLANSIISGITEILNRNDRVIVLEDDLVLSPQFLNYMNDALAFYENVPEVMHISGYMFPVKDTLPETFFYRAASCWGWATWKRAWDKFEPNGEKLLSRFKSAEQRWEFDIQGTMTFHRMLQDQVKGKINSWAIRWYASVFLNNGLCLHPGVSLVNNIGHDGTGVHCGSAKAFEVAVSEQKTSSFTHDIRESKQVVRIMADFYRSLKKSSPIRILDKLTRTASRIVK